jgi:hypothetical protein
MKRPTTQRRWKAPRSAPRSTARRSATRPATCCARRARFPSRPAWASTARSRSKSTRCARQSAKVWQYDVTNSKQREEFGRTRVGTDPQSIEDRQLAASVFTTATPPTDPTPPTGLKLVDKTDIPLTPTQSVRVYDYQRNDSKDRIEFGGTIAVADPVNTFEQALATVSADATADLGAILTTQFNLYKADPSFDGLRIRRVNPSLVEIVRKINNGDKILRMSLRTERVLMRATPSVMVSQVVARANGKYALVVGQSMMRTTGRVTLHRRRNGTSPTDDTVLFLGVLGRMNVSSFLGIPSNSLIYEGTGGARDQRGADRRASALGRLRILLRLERVR